MLQDVDGPATRAHERPSCVAPPVPPAQLGPVLLGIAATLLSFSAMAVSIRELSRTLGILEILALRSGLGVLILIALALVRPALWRTVSAKRIGLHLGRNGVHFVSQVAWAP